jgi:YD repeat-containing protein
MKIESFDRGTALYVTLASGEWHRSVEADEQVTLDYDSQGRLIGVEMLEAPCSGTKNPDTRLELGFL